MMEKGYYLINDEARKKQYIAFMEEALCGYYHRMNSRTWELFEEKREEFEANLAKAVESANEEIQDYIFEKKKRKIKYIHFSYLLSGALSGEILLKLDFYDNKYYRDVEEVDCYWDCSSLFPDFEGEYGKLKEELSKKIMRVQSGELSQLRVGMMVLNYMILKSILTEIVKEEKVEKQLGAYCEEEAYIFYGAYLDQAEIIHQIKEAVG